LDASLRWHDGRGQAGEHPANAALHIELWKYAVGNPRRPGLSARQPPGVFGGSRENGAFHPTPSGVLARTIVKRKGI